MSNSFDGSSRTSWVTVRCPKHVYGQNHLVETASGLGTDHDLSGTKSQDPRIVGFCWHAVRSSYVLKESHGN